MLADTKTMVKFLPGYPWKPVFEGEGGEGGEGNEGEKPKVTPSSNELTPEQQAQVDNLIKKAREEESKKAKMALQELEALKSRSDLTKKQRDDVEERYNKMQQELLTKEELFEQEKRKREAEYEENVNNLTGERDTWKTRYVESTIERAITDAASRHEAFDNEAIIALLRPKTELVEELDDEGEPTSQFTPKVKFMDPEGKDGKPVELLLTVPEAVKKMTDIERYQYLFKGRGTGGVGRTNRGGKPLSREALANDPEAYRKARKAGQI